jgi:hypothetical protein
MIEAIDSHYDHVKSRVLALKNSGRKFSGIMDTRGWPPKQVNMESFYLITLGENPVNANVGSLAKTWYRAMVQWTWMVAGTEIEKGMAGINRGDAYTINQAMKRELRFGSFPLFAEKTATKIGNDRKVIRVSFEPKEYVHWTFLQFTQRVDRESGLIYGLATTYLTAVAEEIVA